MRSEAKKTALFLGFLVTATGGCKKEDSKVPYVDVNITINLDQPEYHDLRTTGGWLYLTGGSRGLIVYRLSSDEFKAYDRHCTYKPSEDCDPALVDSSDIKIVCRDCHGSQYSITDGTVIKGPANEPLREYSTSFDGTLLRITN